MKILFVCHAATRSGAPLLLLHLMRWLRSNTDWSLEILLLGGGPLEDEFLKVSQPAKFSRAARIAHQTAAARILLKNGDPRLAMLRKGDGALRAAQRVAERSFALQSRGERYDLIYANTAATGHALKLLSRFNCPVLTHVHELQYALGLLEQSWALVRRETDRYIAVSQAVKAHLQCWEIAAEKIDVVYGCVETKTSDEDFAAARQRIRAELRLTETDFLVGGSGTLEWRKGSDLFVQLAHQLQGGTDNSHFLWVGGDKKSAFARQLVYDIEKWGLGQQLTITGEVTNPLDYFAALDAFVLTSREDPFPLVCLEGAACGVPILCFENAGGMPEFVESDCGFVAPYLDLQAMAEQLRQLQVDPSSRSALGAAAQQRVRVRHDIEAVAPQITEVIRRTAQQANAPSPLTGRGLG